MTTLLCPLGDSFAAGQTLDSGNGGNGWRKYLADNLAGPNETHDVTMVGSQVSGTAGLHHEGHGGWTIGQVIALVQGGALANPAPAFAGAPNLIVLNAGSNDFGANHSAGQVLADMSTLLDLLLALPSVPGIVVTEQVLQSGSVSHQLTDNSRRQQSFNADLPALVATKPAGRVVIAKTSRIRQQDLDIGGVHPTDAGYRRMEWEIYQALAPWLGWDDGAGGRWMVNRPCPYDSIPGGL
jgi:GDSL-like Lipase/Acylhydrolase family